VRILESVGRILEQSDPLCERVWQRDLSEVAPKVLAALIQPIMKHDEVADAFDFAARLKVEALGDRAALAAKGESLQQPRHCDHDQVNAGGFERLDEAARQSDRYTVLDPHLSAIAGLEADQPRLDQDIALDLSFEELPRVFVAHVGA